MLRRAVAKAADRAEYAGAAIDVVALSAVRATREAQVARGREKLPSIIGTPAPGETANGEAFDGETEVATFPGDLPADPEELFNGGFRGLSSTRFRTGRFPLPALPAAAAGARRPATSPRCLTSASTAPSSS